MKRWPRWLPPWPGSPRYALDIAAVNVSQTPSTIILTVVARNDPLDALSRRLCRYGICSTPLVRSHHSAPRTRPVSLPSFAATAYASKVSTTPMSPASPTHASCQCVMPVSYTHLRAHETVLDL